MRRRKPRIIFKKLRKYPRSQEIYVYTPLRKKTSIRTLELLPGYGDDEIFCQLSDTALEEAPQYQALSYAWGIPEGKRYIICHGELLKVPTNLYDFLRQLRDLTHARTLWADSISIDQKNLQERGDQVKQMAAIYSKAQSVLIWLGQRDLFESVTNDKDICALGEKFLESYTVPNVPAGVEYHPLKFNTSNGFHVFWTAFATLSHNPWFNRLWVVQEAGLAQAAIIMIGHRTIRFERLMARSYRVSEENPDITNTYDITGHHDTFWSFPGQLRRPIPYQDLDLLEVLVNTRYQLASDPRISFSHFSVTQARRWMTM